MMKVFVDTNILIDLVCSREPFVEEAKYLFALGFRGGVSLAVSALSFVNTVYIGRKYGFTKSEIEQSLIAIANFVEVVDLKGTDVVDLLSSEWKDYEDATQHRGALDFGAECVVTRNKKDFHLSVIPVYTIEEFRDLVR